MSQAKTENTTDLELRCNVMDELDFEPSVHSANIGVGVENGIVTLSGHVGSYVEKLAAEKAARDSGRVILEGDVRDWQERNAVEDAAWSAPGVRWVEDRLNFDQFG